jgi:drug/metabolite transporter (DMT)-like permease
MGRDDDIAAIARGARRTRRPTPRWLWIASVIVGVICATGFAVAMLQGRDAPPARGAARPPAGPAGAGLGVGLSIGGMAGLAIGYVLGRQRRDHSSRNSP